MFCTGMAPRTRALEVFAHLRVWDTELNNGVLVYVQVADRNVEIVADRGFDEPGGVPAEWQAVCRLMEEHFSARGGIQAGSVARVDAIGQWCCAATFPAAPGQNGPIAQPIA